MYISSFVCLIIQKKNVTNIDKEKKKKETIRYTYSKTRKEREYDQHRDIQRQK